MGLRGALELYHCVPATERYRVVRAFPCPTIKSNLDDLYGDGNWCVLWDLAVDRLNLPGAKEDPAMALLSATMVWEKMDQEGIKVVACVEGKLWSDYRNSTKPPFYRGSRTPRPDDQFKSERRVLEALVPRGLLVGPASGCSGELNAAKRVGKDFDGMQGALVKRARGVETRASRDAESVRVRFFPRRSQDTDALVLVDKTVRVDDHEGFDQGVWSFYDRTAMLAYWGLSLSAYAFYAALSEESDAVLSISTPSTRVCTGRVSHRFGVSEPAKWAARDAKLSEPRGRTGLGAGPLVHLLNSPGHGSHGPYSVEELVGALKYAAAPDISVEINQLYPNRAVAEIFRDAVQERAPFPAVAAGEEEPRGRAVAVAIVEFLQDPARMTTSGKAVHHQMVLNEIWHFAEYIVGEVESHDIPSPPITFEDESRWDGTVAA